MKAEDLFKIYNFEYHDGNVSDVVFDADDMILTVIRCPMTLKSKEDEESLFQRLKFKNVSDIYLWKDDETYTSTTLWEDMWKTASKEDVEGIFVNGVHNWIDDAFYDNGMVVYDYLLRFRCDDVEVLETRTNPEYFQ